MLDGLPLDPHVILGLEKGASAEEIHEAFRQKSKKHHPDLGGDEWAFKIVVRAYEILSEEPSSGLPAAPIAPREEFQDTGQIRRGIRDRNIDPARVVQVEVLWMRYEVDDVLELLDKHADRNLSGSLNISWPSPDLASQAPRLPSADLILRALNAAFDELRAKTPVLTARSRIDAGRFDAWLSYPSGSIAWSAFKVFHVGLKARGLGVHQWTRDLNLPREDR